MLVLDLVYKEAVQEIEASGKLPFRDEKIIIQMWQESYKYHVYESSKILVCINTLLFLGYSKSSVCFLKNVYVQLNEKVWVLTIV